MIRLLIACTLVLLARAGFAQPFTVVVLPDTQNFSMNHPDIYEAMCEWIIENREARNIVFVSHVGDIVNNDTPRQWANARRAHDILSAAHVPQGLAIGNHDGESLFREHLVGENYLKRFGPDALYDFGDPKKGVWRDQPWYGGHSASGLSSYQLLDPSLTGGVGFLFIHLEVGLREAEVEWADEIIASHPDRCAIVSTHRYIYDYRIIRGRFEPYIHEHFDGMYKGQHDDADALFERLADNRNFMMVWCGHVDGEHRQHSHNEHGAHVHELLQDYQSFSPRGGSGWMRLYEFDVENGEVRVETYSPVVDGGRVRTVDDTIRELRRAFGMYLGEAERRSGVSLAELDPMLKGAILAAFATEGAFSRFVETMETGEGEFAFLFPLIERIAPENATRITKLLRHFPYDQMPRGLVAILDREGALILGAVLNGDFTRINQLLTENDNARLIEAFIEGESRDSSFTLEVDFSEYVDR